MKTKLILCGFLASIVISNSYAQSSSDYIRSVAMGKTISAATLTNRTSDVTIKAQHSFISYFKNTNNENWTAIGKDYLVRFTLNGEKNSALFTKNGNLIYAILYGSEKDLPNEVRKLIKSSYYDYNIVSAIKVEENHQTMWIVQMEDEKTNITVRVEDGEMEQVQQYNKTN